MNRILMLLCAATAGIITTVGDSDVAFARSDVVRESFWLDPDEKLEFIGKSVRKVHVYNATGSNITVCIYRITNEGEQHMFSTVVRPGDKITEKKSVGTSSRYRITIQNGSKKSDVYIHIERT